MKLVSRIAIGAAVAVGLGAVALRFLLPGALPHDKPARHVSAHTTVIERGEYLARAGDCVACHTDKDGRVFAGGRPMPTPFGNLYVPNITPDDDTGIGRWTADDFYRMMHAGVSRDGTLLYPAMPFASYTKVTRADSDAIFAYLMSVPPVRQKNRPHELHFPFDNRDLLLGWRSLYFREGEYKPDPTQGAEWNRGAYLVQGLGHCAMCHTAINALGGSSESKAFEGGMIPNQNCTRRRSRPTARPAWATGRSTTSPTCCRWARRTAARSTARWRRWSTTACSTSTTRTRGRWPST